MSNQYLQHRIFPLNTASKYEQYTNVDFRLSFPGRKMVANTMRIEGRFNVYKNSTPDRLSNTDNKSYFDNMVGINAVFQDLTTTTANQGNLELITEAPRYSKMVSSSMATENDMGNSHNSCELRNRTLVLSNRMMRGEKFDFQADGDLAQNGMSFSTKPICCLNSAMSAGNLPEVKYSTTGDITFSIRLARNEAVFFGSDVETARAAGDNYNYDLSELSVVFSSVPDDNQPQMPITLATVLNVRQSIQSTFSNISVNIPSMSNGCSVSFLKQSEENNYKFNNTRLERPLKVSQVEYLFNDATNKYITFNLKSQTEILGRYLDSMGNSKVNNFSTSLIKANEAYGVGIPFNQYLDLSVNKFGINITSGISSAEPLVAYLYFHGRIQL
mgnify:FL=1|tara:strand:+ start:2269 stop:3426 length:1158 start_codon:yes stop_codon:yes gene_type:complete